MEKPLKMCMPHSYQDVTILIGADLKAKLLISFYRSINNKRRYAMKTRLLVCSALATLLAVVLMGVGSAAAFENITSQEAYEMVNSGQAILIDVRTLEECYWVGMPDVVAGGLYVIPWLTRTIAPDGTVTTDPNPDFNNLVEKAFQDKDQALITMCRSGGRSTYAAERLEGLAYTNVYEIDNPLREQSNYPGGSGGFQGTSYSGAYDGYRGYPKRFLATEIPIEPQSKLTRIKSIIQMIQSLGWIQTFL